MLPKRLAFLIGVLTSVGVARAQVPAGADSVRDDLPRVFLDCQANGCDGDYLRTELTWLNFVRDRTLALVHILATSQSTGSGGTEVTVAFIGLGLDSARVDTIVAHSLQSDTFDERRQLVRRIISQGMLRFVANTPLASRLSVAYRPAPGVTSAASRGARDPWNQWVFRVGGGTFLNGEETYKYYNVNGSVNADRITAGSKTRIGLRGNRSQDRFTLPDGEVITTKRQSYNADAMFVKSLGEHWSVGVQANAASSIHANLELGTRVGPAIEYDLFPYSQSTRRQLIFRYSVGAKSLNYDSVTVYDKLHEQLLDHRLVVAAEATQPWGGVFGSITASQYLSDLKKHRLDGFVGMNWRVVRGLNVGFDVSYSKLRDQINIKRGTATDEQILLRLRQLATGYYYFASVNISYTFGSVFSNVVNPRFNQNSGGFFF
jgi:hypothetical protein